MSSTSSNLIIPVTLWAERPPTHCISRIILTPENLVTGCKDGSICIWTLDNIWQMKPERFLMGHSTAITALCRGSFHEPLLISASDDGEICLWNIYDSIAVEQSKTQHTHTFIEPHQLFGSRDARLVCQGNYADIEIIDPLTLSVLFCLSSRMTPDWISAFAVLRPVATQDDVIVAISNSGTVKVWILCNNEQPEKELFENESKQIRCLNAHTLRCCPYNQRTVLIVCAKFWQIYDASDFSLRCSESSRRAERWAGGDFVSIDSIVAWSTEGRAYLYKLPANLHQGRPSDPTNPKNVGPQVYKILQSNNLTDIYCPPVMSYILWTRDKKVGLLIRGDCDGQITTWELSESLFETEINSNKRITFENLPVIGPKSISKMSDAWTKGHIRGIVDVIEASGENRLEVTATTYIRCDGKIVCGREDGTIIIIPAIACAASILLNEELQNVSLQKMNGEHCGRVTCLLYPFNENVRYDKRHLISGGIDFSVIIWDLSLLTILHVFSVHGGELMQLLVPPDTCNARILPCICAVASDHSLSLLHLKDQKCVLLAARHMFPIHAVKWRPLDDFVLIACTDGTVSVWQMETGHLDRVVHGVVAEQMMAACSEKVTNNQVSQTAEEDMTNPTISLAQAFRRRNLATFKVLAHQRLASSNISGNKIDIGIEIRADLSPIIVQGFKSNNNDPDAHLLFFDMEALIVQLLTEDALKESSIKIENIEDLKQEVSISSILAKVKDKAEDVGRGFTSSSKNIPSNRSTTPTPAKPVRPPPPQSNKETLAIQASKLLISLLHCWGVDVTLDGLIIKHLNLCPPKSAFSFGLASRGARMALYVPGAIPKSYNMSRGASTHRVLSAIAISNTLMGSNYFDHTAKQIFSQIASFHCVRLPELLGEKYIPVALAELARRWQHKCLEIRDAARALLLGELRQMGVDGRQTLIDIWSAFLPKYDEKTSSTKIAKDKESHVTGPEQEVEEEDDEEEQLLVEGRGTGNRQRQATAIVLLAVIGSEFGAQVTLTDGGKTSIPEGFGIKDYGLAMNTSKALSHIVLRSSRPYSAMQRAAVDLLGRGFMVWEPYLDVTAVLLGLLELSVQGEKLLPSVPCKLPFTPAADACRTARDSLEMIARSRPTAFISTMAREVARYNALIAQSQTPTATLSNSILVRGKKDILRVLEVLVDKNTSDVVQLLVEVVDISIHCIDSNSLKQHGLHEMLPSLCKLAMISSCKLSKKVACGSRTGSLAIYDLKNQKCQVFNAHKGQIAAVSISPDSKYCATYSIVDNTVCIWQFGSSSIFTMGSSQTRCIKTLSAPQWQPAAGTSILKIARLFWSDPKLLIMMTALGTETKFNI